MSGPLRDIGSPPKPRFHETILISKKLLFLHPYIELLRSFIALPDRGDV